MHITLACPVVAAYPRDLGRRRDVSQELWCIALRRNNGREHRERLGGRMEDGKVIRRHARRALHSRLCGDEADAIKWANA